MFHRSERLLLRPVFDEDWEAIYDGINDEGIIRMLAVPPWPYLPEHAREFVARERDPKSPVFVVTLPSASGAPVIGSIGFKADEGEVSLGYWFARPYWGRGYATEAGRAAIAIARMLGHRRVVAQHAVDNPASGKVLRKLGFRPTGELKLEFSNGCGEEVMSCCYVNEIAGAEADPDPSMYRKAA